MYIKYLIAIRNNVLSQGAYFVGCVIALCVSLMMGSPANAKPGFIFLITPSIALQGLPTTQDVCLQYLYDQNGNRLSRSASEVPTSQPTWGASVFGCANWA